jgi:hypothetical protein
MAKKHQTTPAEIESMSTDPEPAAPDMDAIIDEATASLPAVITLEPWDSPKIQSFQLNWQGKEETREIGVPLTREEIQDHATKLADTVTTIQELEDEKKINADRINAQIKEQEKIQNRVSALIRQGHNTKPVPCIWLFELAGRNDSGAFIRDPCYKTIIRKDTGAVIEVKPITHEERQMSLPLEEEEGFSLDGDLPPAPAVTEVPDEQVTQADLEAAYECGVSAHAVDDMTANPYPAHTKQATAWENGWKDMDADASAGLV